MTIETVYVWIASLLCYKSTVKRFIIQPPKVETPSRETNRSKEGERDHLEDEVKDKSTDFDTQEASEISNRPSDVSLGGATETNKSLHRLNMR